MDNLRKKYPDSESVLEAMKECELNITNIKHQLEMSNATKHATGQFADPIWYRKASHAARMYGVTKNQLQTLLGEYRRDEKKARQANTEIRFIDAAMSVLPKETIQQIFDYMHVTGGNSNV